MDEVDGTIEETLTQEQDSSTAQVKVLEDGTRHMACEIHVDRLAQEKLAQAMEETGAEKEKAGSQLGPKE